MKDYIKKFKIPIFFSVLIFVLLISFFILHNSYAFSLHTLSDKVSRHAPGIGSNHQISFTSPLGLNANGDYFTIEFADGFDLTGISYTDIDLTQNGTEQDLAGTPGAAIWGVLVNPVNRQITFFHPTTAGAGIEEEFVAEIGTNADYGNIGANQIINPADLGSKVITITTSKDELGKLAVPIANDQVGVSGGNFSIILDPPFNITSSSMDLTWSWADSPDPNFDYFELYVSTEQGIDPASLRPSDYIATPTGGVTNFDFNVTGLSSNTTYYFLIVAETTIPDQLLSNEAAGTTSSGGGYTPPPTPLPIEEPLIIETDCPYFIKPVRLEGTRPYDSRIIVNGSEDNVVYYGHEEFSVLIFEPEIGDNLVEYYAEQPGGGQSETVNLIYKFWAKGDSNINYLREDRDISLMAGCFWKSSQQFVSGKQCCLTDFNEDGTINDFDIPPIAFYWDSRYIFDDLSQCTTLGDVNGDYKVDQTDYDLVVLMLTGDLPYNVCGDINQDGVIGPSDHTRMYDKIILGLNWW